MRVHRAEPGAGRDVNDPADYPWSSYRYNTMGQPSDLIVPLTEYLRLGADAENRQLAYRCLFASRLSEQVITQILDTTNKAWVPGNVHFKLQIQALLYCRVEPAARGGDRKSELFKINRLVATAT